jgi:hypothetical protein
MVAASPEGSFCGHGREIYSGVASEVSLGAQYPRAVTQHDQAAGMFADCPTSEPSLLSSLTYILISNARFYGCFSGLH